VTHKRQGDLMDVGKAPRLFGLLTGHTQRRQQHPRQNPDDGDNHQQLNQGKRTALPCPYHSNIFCLPIPHATFPLLEIELPANRLALQFVIYLPRARRFLPTLPRRCLPSPIAASRCVRSASRGRHAPRSAPRRTAAIRPAAAPTLATGHPCSSPAARSVALIPHLPTNLVDNISLSIQ